MNGIDQKFNVVPAINYSNSYFIFREYGQEVRVKVINNEFYPSHDLTSKEVEQLKIEINGIN